MVPVPAAQISTIREFNRFYTARLGLLRKRHLDGDFSLTESRILYEIGSRPRVIASALCTTLNLDAGYMSRVIAGLSRRKLVRHSASSSDGRERFLTLTPAGQDAVARLDAQSNSQIERILAELTPAERQNVANALASAAGILKGACKSTLKIERITRTSIEALQILKEYYEAVNVVQRDDPAALQSLLNEPASAMWLARLDDKIVGCIVLRKLSSTPGVGECKRLYVRPEARGNHVATLLLEALEQHARVHKFRWIYLDSYDDLKPAIALYQKHGYQRCKRYNDNPQATLFMRKRLKT